MLIKNRQKRRFIVVGMSPTLDQTMLVRGLGVFYRLIDEIC